MTKLLHSVASAARPMSAVAKPSIFHGPYPSSRLFSARAAAADSGGGAVTSRAGRSPLETRVSLAVALAVQASTAAQRAVSELAVETVKYAFPRRFEPRNLEEALMTVPDLETVEFKVLKRTNLYDIREVEPYFIAEITMPGNTGFDFNGSSQAFNALAGYLFGKNTKRESMAMTTPVYTRKDVSQGEKMDMTTPVITKRTDDKWKMSFVLPSKYGSNLPVPEDPSIKILEIPRKIVAVTAFSGFVSDDEVKHREYRLCEDLEQDAEYELKPDGSVEIAQFNPPFTLPFTRRNEIALEVERKGNSE